MEHEKRSDNDEQLKAHSLPGTNQAGKGPGQKERTNGTAPESDSKQKPQDPQKPTTPAKE